MRGGACCCAHGLRRLLLYLWPVHCHADLPSLPACAHASPAAWAPTLPPAAPPPLCAAGFTHAAFVFGAESAITKSGINGKEVPVGALVSFIQKVGSAGWGVQLGSAVVVHC